MPFLGFNLGAFLLSNFTERAGVLYEDEQWNVCLKRIHPAWLLAYRIASFIVLLGLLIGNVAESGGGTVYFYTQWTFTLVTIYFGLTSCFSICQCCFKHGKFEGNTVNPACLDAEQGTEAYEEPHSQNTAGAWGYMRQTSAGAVLLSDLVFWFILYPFTTVKDFKLDLNTVCMHSVIALFLLGETSLNSMRLPMFQFANLILWTAIFMISQWIFQWWRPYPFFRLSPYAPLWHFALGALFMPCYVVFALIMR